MNRNDAFSLPDKPFACSAAEIEQTLRSSAKNGLSSDDATRRVEQFGPNQLPEEEKSHWLFRFARHFHDTLIYVLIGAAIITGLLQHWVDTGVILAVVVINAIIGFIQEGKAEKALAGLRQMMSTRARVLREGHWTEIDAEQLVPGDIVALRSGNRVPADLRLTEALNLRIEESALTGESVPTDKSLETLPENTGVGDRANMAFSGTLVAAGRGVGIVTGTGSETEIGKINTMIAEVQTLATPLTRQMAAFSKVLSLAILAMAGVMFGLGWALHDYTTQELFFAAIGFAVAAIPEGLPAILTITLAIGVQKMARRKAITRQLSAVETLGSVTVICSDKTGTLTRNEMTVRHVVTAEASYDVSGEGYQPEGQLSRDGDRVEPEDEAVLPRLVQVMDGCNDTMVESAEGQWRVIGEPTEGALRVLARKSGRPETKVERIASIPFESENKFMAVLTDAEDGSDGRRILLKGAPDRLLDRCQWQANPSGERVPLERAFWEEQIHALSDQGLRVLAAAAREVDATRDSLEIKDLGEDMVFLGIVGIVDPPRPEAIEAIQKCRAAGIRVKMITGDHAGTALAIGREMQLSDQVHAISGGQIEDASDEELEKLVQENDIFARTSPNHKLRIVTALQAGGHVVAMTGDGVNDAPALKRADVGVAMGIKGTEATKEAAQIVLADDNFASIERAVEEGRAIYDNLRKAIVFILPTNGAQSFVMLAAVMFGMTLPLTPVQILWINMVTAVTLALALAFEPAEGDIMRRPPRKPGTSILDLMLLWRIAFVSFLVGGFTIAIFVYEQRSGSSEELSRTIAINTLAAGQIFYLFNTRFLRESSFRLAQLFKNRVAWIAVTTLICLQLLFVYTPLMNTLFHSEPMQLRHWLFPLVAGIAVFILVEIEKALISGRTRHRPGTRQTN